MRPTRFPLHAATKVFSCLFVLVAFATAAERPHYGGTLHTALRAAPTSLDPVHAHWDNSGNVLGLLFDDLITIDERGRLQPALATSWQSDSANQRWHFVLRAGVTFSDGTPLSPSAVAASLRAANSQWKVFAESSSITVDLISAAPDLAAELTLPRNRIVKQDSGKYIGTGPFVVRQWDSAKHLILVARDDYWNGRPFLDSIEIDLGKNFRNQAIALDLNQSQLIEATSGQGSSATVGGSQFLTSAPIELMALVFSHPAASSQEQHLRAALAFSIDRDLLNHVVLQGEAEPAGSLLPDWMTGYGFLFTSKMNMTRALEERSEVPQAPVRTLSFDAADPIENVIAQRIVLNASDAGLRLQIVSGSEADMRLVRAPLTSVDAHTALRDIAAALGLPEPKYDSDLIDSAYNAENALLQTQQIIPLLHSRMVWSVARTVNNFRVTRDGRWQLADAWLSADKP